MFNANKGNGANTADQLCDQDVDTCAIAVFASYLGLPLYVFAGSENYPVQIEPIFGAQHGAEALAVMFLGWHKDNKAEWVKCFSRCVCRKQDSSKSPDIQSPADAAIRVARPTSRPEVHGVSMREPCPASTSGSGAGDARASTSGSRAGNARASTSDSWTSTSKSSFSPCPEERGA